VEVTGSVENAVFFYQYTASYPEVPRLFLSCNFLVLDVCVLFVCVGWALVAMRSCKCERNRVWDYNCRLQIPPSKASSLV